MSQNIVMKKLHGDKDQLDSPVQQLLKTKDLYIFSCQQRILSSVGFSHVTICTTDQETHEAKLHFISG
jgi:hypothetical protein